ncbi:MAG: hypothetical protein ABI878_15855 [Acidobacteriota bacterium]
MISLTEGSKVSCGICKRETNIKFTTERTGGTAYDLACQHRNGYCETCDMLVPDRSETIWEVTPRCPNCNPEEAEPEEEDEEPIAAAI